MKKIEDIASMHLGKAGDGSVVKPYVTPHDVDASLLVPIPRELNRAGLGMPKLEFGEAHFDGYDVWNCYEFSFMLPNGFPKSGVLKICISCNSQNIVESKSLKLYLNSYNMATFADVSIAVMQIESDIKDALGPIGDYVKVGFHDYNDNVYPFEYNFIDIEKTLDVDKLMFDTYSEDHSLLKVVPREEVINYGEYAFKTSSLRSNCRVTNQPDWGDVYVWMEGKDVIEPGSLLKYIVSMRNENHFHEEICETIYWRIHQLLPNNNLMVACLYTRRGGIDINPIRVSEYSGYKKLAPKLVDCKIPHCKTARQ